MTAAVGEEELHFRPWARASDGPRIATMLGATGLFRPDEIEIAVELVEERLEQGESSGYHFLFLERSDQILGYSCYGPIPLTQDSWDLYWIAIEPGSHRSGLGRRLLLETERRARVSGARQLFVDTSGRDDYLATRSFYLGCGYREAARLVDFYAPEDDKVIYARTLE